jgi:hypothetical protein
VATNNGVYVNNGAAVDAMNSDRLTPSERKRMTAEAQGTPFDPFERLFSSFDGGTAFAYSDFEAADYREMLRRDGQAAKLEQVLTLPIRGASWTITPDKQDSGQAKLIEECLGDKLNLVIDQMTSAVTYRRAFFETSWTMSGGRLIYSDVAYRPPTGCEPGFDPQSGKPRGFRQRIVPVAGVWPKSAMGNDKYDPGWVTIKPSRSFIYVHGTHREPVNGLSDLEVALWCHQTKQKIIFLWCQFLEQTALPKTLVYADDQATADARADLFRQLRSSGVAGVERPGEATDKIFEILESSGDGATQFQNIITFLDSMMSASTLSSFTDLSSASGGSAGSFALSADQSEFFLNSRQAVADEMADSIRRDLFGPLVAFNFGVNASVPKIEIGPISKEQGKNALNMLNTIITAVNLNVPRDFVDQLTLLCANMLGMNPDSIKGAIAKDAAARQDQADLQSEVNKAQAQQALQDANDAAQAPAAPGVADPTAPPPVSTAPPPSLSTSSAPGATEAANVMDAVDTVYELVRGSHGRGRTVRT